MGRRQKQKARGGRWESKGARPLFLSFHPPAIFKSNCILFSLPVRAQKSKKREAIDRSWQLQRIITGALKNLHTENFEIKQSIWLATCYFFRRSLSIKKVVGRYLVRGSIFRLPFLLFHRLRIYTSIFREFVFLMRPTLDVGLFLYVCWWV